jgi:gliding motility-associated-like protein
MFSKTPLLLVFFLCTLNMMSTAQTSAWSGYVGYFDAQNPNVYRKEAPLLPCQFVKNGILRIEPNLTPQSAARRAFWSNFEFKSPICLSDNFTYEIRFKNNSAINGIPAYDAVIDLSTSAGSTGCALMGETSAQTFTSLSVAGQVLVSNQPYLVLNYTDWVVVKLKFQNKTVSYYYNDKLFFSAPYTGNVCNLDGFNLRFKGSGAVDWVKVVNDNDKTVAYFEEFTSCTALAKPADCDASLSAVANAPCEGDTLKLSTPKQAMTYEWTGPNGYKSSLQNPMMTKAGVINDGTYTLKAQINSCQTSTQSINVKVKTKPVLNLGGDTSICNGQTYALDAKNDGSTYNWSSGSNSRFLSVKTSGTYAVTVTNNNACKVADTVKINVAASPIIAGITTKKPTCYGKCDGEVSANAKGGFGAPYTYKWSGDRSSLNVISRCAGDITLTVTDSKGCKIETVASLSQPSKINAVAWGDTIYNGFAVRCANSQDGQATVKPTGGAGGYSVIWKTNPLQVSTTAMGLKADTTYKVYVFDKNGCNDSTTVQLTAPAAVSASFSVKDVKCNGDKNGEITLKDVKGGVAPYSFIFQDKKFTFDSLTRIDNLESRDYAFEIKDANNCAIPQNMTIKNPPKLKIVSTEDTLIHFGDDLTLYAGLAPPSVLSSVRWTSNLDSLNFECKNCRFSKVSPRVPTFFKVTVKDTFGCEARKEILVRVDKKRKVFVPTAFSPNEDGQNDFFMVYAGRGAKRVLNFSIFNRWGALIHQARDFSPDDDTKSWNGQFDGTNSLVDTYIWFAEIEFEDGEKEIFKGDVALIR